MLSVDVLSISLTPINSGLLSDIIQHKGDMDTSHCVKANRESILFCIDAPEGK